MIGFIRNYFEVYWRVFASGPQYTNLTWTVSIEYIAHFVLLMLEPSDARTVLCMMFDIVTIRVIPSLTDSLISSFPHTFVTTLLNDNFVCFVLCCVLMSYLLALCELKLNVTINCIAECWAEYLAVHSESCIIWGPTECFS